MCFHCTRLYRASCTADLAVNRVAVNGSQLHGKKEKVDSFHVHNHKIYREEAVGLKSSNYRPT